MIRKYLLPDMYYDTVYDVNYKALYEKGVRLIVFDIDNTLKTYEEKVPNDMNLELISKLKKMGFEICLLSNGRKSRVVEYNKELNLRAIHMALKPFSFNLRKIMREFKKKSTETVIIGDQIFTDMLLGKRMKISTVLIKPIKPKTTKVEKIKRKLEKMVLKLYNNTQCL